MGLLEPTYLGEPLPGPAGAGLPGLAGAGAGQGVFCPHHQCGPLLPEGRVRKRAPFLHPGGLRPVPVRGTLLL